MGIGITTRGGGSNVVVGDDSVFSIPAPSPPPAPTLNSLSPFGLDPKHSIFFTFTLPFEWNTITVEVYTDAGLTHLQTSITAFAPPPATVGGLAAGTSYWVRIKVTLGALDSQWSNVRSTTTNP